MNPDLHIVDVEVVEGNLIGVLLSDDTAILISAEHLLALDLPRFVLLSEDACEVTVVEARTLQPLYNQNN